MASFRRLPSVQRRSARRGSIVVVVRPGGFISSWSQPKRIIATLAPMIAMTALMLVIPE